MRNLSGLLLWLGLPSRYWQSWHYNPSLVDPKPRSSPKHITHCTEMAENHVEGSKNAT